MVKNIELLLSQIMNKQKSDQLSRIAESELKNNLNFIEMSTNQLFQRISDLENGYKLISDSMFNYQLELSHQIQELKTKYGGLSKKIKSNSLTVNDVVDVSKGVAKQVYDSLSFSN